ncbi:F510_1955 family glycosylhydrolase [Aminobacter sp. MDW-2]|uniref:F510_1955 family glycosylhydrolase n=1 Tax=Aminobacter sp. MDW-2 TaxID=2666139 RepID=UPI0012B0A48B|nr:exo-alpha-sialidase [Aminobacter sp. MDW-2]MRX32051.1 exo-alpha-sialidase [Aminobacter sp. MDW-2]QNH32515.1 exo-alpha-sialidase [Aminobacter sp. MDW-2]
MACRPHFLAFLSVILALGTALPATAQGVSVTDLAGKTHIHGLAFDRADSSSVLVATHHGLMKAAPDGTVTPVSDSQDDFMGFTPHPADATILFASGHPKGGGNLGFIRSDDSGKSWQQIAPGVDGPVDFHQLAVSPSNPDVLYGSYGAIQASHDGGKSWTIAGDAPAKLIDLAVSPTNPDIVYAATEDGLMVSRDGARNWQQLALGGAPVTTVELAADGTIYAFAPGRGLLRATEAAPDFMTVAEGPDPAGYILHLALDAPASNRMVAVTGTSAIVVSSDAGATWSVLGSK